MAHFPLIPVAFQKKKNDALSSCVALDDGTVLEAAELDAIALLADGTMILIP